MNIVIEIKNYKDDLELEKEVFCFYLLEHPMRLSLKTYHLLQRKTRRHKYCVNVAWSMYDKRNNTVSEAPLTEEIKQQARQQLLDLFKDISVGVK